MAINETLVRFINDILAIRRRKPLTHYPADGEMGEMWQYDSYGDGDDLDCNPDTMVVIQLFPQFVNGRGGISESMTVDVGGDAVDYIGCFDSWVGDWGTDRSNWTKDILASVPAKPQCTCRLSRTSCERHPMTAADFHCCGWCGGEECDCDFGDDRCSQCQQWHATCSCG